MLHPVSGRAALSRCDKRLVAIAALARAQPANRERVFAIGSRVRENSYSIVVEPNCRLSTAQPETTQPAARAVGDKWKLTKPGRGETRSYYAHTLAASA
jgi:site-specific DNA-cytosine methylase